MGLHINRFRASGIHELDLIVRDGGSREQGRFGHGRQPAPGWHGRAEHSPTSLRCRRPRARRGLQLSFHHTFYNPHFCVAVRPSRTYYSGLSPSKGISLIGLLKIWMPQHSRCVSTTAALRVVTNISCAEKARAGRSSRPLPVSEQHCFAVCTQLST